MSRFKSPPVEYVSVTRRRDLATLCFQPNGTGFISREFIRCCYRYSVIDWVCKSPAFENSLSCLQEFALRYLRFCNIKNSVSAFAQYFSGTWCWWWWWWW